MEIVIKKCSVLGFDMESYDSPESMFLGNFLLCDLSITFLDTYKKWALEPRARCSSGNETYQEKVDGYIYIGHLFLDDPLYGPCFKLTIREYISLLDQWKAAVNARPDVITITKENGRLVVKTEKK